MAFFNDDNQCVLLQHTYGESLSSSTRVMSNIAEILEEHAFLMPDLLKRSTALSTFVHRLYTYTEAFASKLLQACKHIILVVFVIAVEIQMILLKYLILFLFSLIKRYTRKKWFPLQVERAHIFNFLWIYVR